MSTPRNAPKPRTAHRHSDATRRERKEERADVNTTTDAVVTVRETGKNTAHRHADIQRFHRIAERLDGNSGRDLAITAADIARQKGAILEALMLQLAFAEPSQVPPRPSERIKKKEPLLEPQPHKHTAAAVGR